MHAMNKLLHVGAFAAYAFTLYYTFTILEMGPLLAEKFKKYNTGQLQFLTVWNVILQAVFFALCILNDLIGTNAVNPKKPPFIRKVKDYLHASLGFPLAVFVSLLFWALMAVDRELVLPRAMDSYFPWWLNHLMHTLIFFTTVGEMILTPRQYPKRLNGMITLSAFVLTYLAWIHYVKYRSGAWMYPIMEVLSLQWRIVFFAAQLAFCLMCYSAGEALNNIVWGNEKSKRNKSHSKSQ